MATRQECHDYLAVVKDWLEDRGIYAYYDNSGSLFSLCIPSHKEYMGTCRYMYIADGPTVKFWNRRWRSYSKKFFDENSSKDLTVFP